MPAAHQIRFRDKPFASRPRTQTRIGRCLAAHQMPASTSAAAPDWCKLGSLIGRTTSLRFRAEETRPRPAVAPSQSSQRAGVGPRSKPGLRFGLGARLAGPAGAGLSAGLIPLGTAATRVDRSERHAVPVLGAAGALADVGTGRVRPRETQPLGQLDTGETDCQSARPDAARKSLRAMVGLLISERLS
jgi:hypothetical protein